MPSETVDKFAAANQAYFDSIADTFDDVPRAVEQAQRSAEAIRQAYPFNEEVTTVMEYACGTGLVSKGLAAYAKRIVGVDISQGVVDKFNQRFNNQGIPSEEIKAVRVELKGQAGELDDERFDVIACVSSYHHFADINEMTKTLAYFLKPGGTLLVVDLGKVEEHHSADHGAHEHKHTQPLFPESVHHFVPHRHGLGEPEMRKAFEGAGLTFTFDPKVMAMKKNGHNVDFFVAKGVKSQAVP